MREMLEDNTIEETLVTEKEYIEHPLKCPVCGSERIYTGTLEVVGPNTVIAPVDCEDCTAYWTEGFTLTSLTDVYLPRKHILPKEEDDEPYTQIPIKGE